MIAAIENMRITAVYVSNPVVEIVTFLSLTLVDTFPVPGPKVGTSPVPSQGVFH